MLARPCTMHARWIIASAFALLVTLGAYSARAEDTVRMAVGVDPVYTPWWIAQEKGFFTKYGVKAEITQFSGGPDACDATMAGEADISASGSATWMPRLVRGNLLVLGTMATSPDALKMAALSNITSLEQLEGKKVGTVGGSTTDYLWALLARKLNVPESKFQLVPMPPPELVPSLDRHDIEAYFVWEPWATRAVQVSGKDKVHILANSGDVDYMLNFIVVANGKFADAKPDAVIRVLAALRDAIDFQNQNPVEAARIGAETNKLKPDLAGYVIGLYKFSLGMPPGLEKAVKDEEAWMRGMNRVKGDPIDWAKTIDRSFLDKALAMK
jgi:ABC-type nitrate/sulfonate/bicarbonate transport system substrate-binding protein